MAKEIIPELCPRSKGRTNSIPILDYLRQSGRIDDRCTCCGDNLFTDEMLDKLASVRIAPSSSNLMRVENNHVRGYREEHEFKWLLCGLQTSKGTFFRTTCWNCFWRNLRQRALDGKHVIRCNTKKNSWWMRVVRGEDAYPEAKASAIGRYWADLMFTTLTKDELDALSSRFDTASRESFIRRYGEDEGNRKYEEYVKFHSDKNKFEYKHEHLGWSREQFEEFNKNRSVTLELCVKKHGQELGQKIFDEYCAKQSYAGCKLEYFVEKYGEDEGRKEYMRVNSEKAITEKNLVEKYGEEEGKARYAHWKEKMKESVKNLPNLPWSKVSQQLFDEILAHIPSDQYSKVKYATFGGGEECIEGRHGYMFPDFLYDNKKIIEFNGDYWHRNPLIYDESAESKSVWKRDAERQAELERLGYEVLVVWEKDFRDDEAVVVQRCLDFLGY